MKKLVTEVKLWILLLPEQGSFLQTMQAQNCVLIELLDR